jgi:hypothetical protein
MHQCMCPVLSSLASFASEKSPYRLELLRGIEETPIHKCFNIQEIKFVLTILISFFSKNLRACYVICSTDVPPSFSIMSSCF